MRIRDPVGRLCLKPPKHEGFIYINPHLRRFWNLMGRPGMTYISCFRERDEVVVLLIALLIGR
uniref:Uncharacterized protein n=1 Tax=Picea glauca TaxID=3330 RepID=A0A101LVN5_PICGL|nr:hypothetical protein ABT39_MTgene1977 [Picea glauca]QHR88018.1 hypothetical protein Q903MT_gene2030 [Picea sitchensis]